MKTERFFISKETAKQNMLSKSGKVKVDTEFVYNFKRVRVIGHDSNGNNQVQVINSL